MADEKALINNISASVQQQELDILEAETKKKCIKKAYAELLKKKESLIKQLSVVKKDISKNDEIIRNLKLVRESQPETFSVLQDSTIYVRLCKKHEQKKFDELVSQQNETLKKYEERNNETRELLQNCSPLYKTFQKQSVKLQLSKVNCLVLQQKIKIIQNIRKQQTQIGRDLFIADIVELAKAWVYHRDCSKALLTLEEEKVNQKQCLKKLLEVQATVKNTKQNPRAILPISFQRTIPKTEAQKDLDKNTALTGLSNFHIPKPVRVLQRSNTSFQQSIPIPMTNIQKKPNIIENKIIKRANSKKSMQKIEQISKNLNKMYQDHLKRQALRKNRAASRNCSQNNSLNTSQNIMPDLNKSNFMNDELSQEVNHKQNNSQIIQGSNKNLEEMDVASQKENQNKENVAVRKEVQILNQTNSLKSQSNMRVQKSVIDQKCVPDLGNTFRNTNEVYGQRSSTVSTYFKQPLNKQKEKENPAGMPNNLTVFSPRFNAQPINHQPEKMDSMIVEEKGDMDYPNTSMLGTNLGDSYMDFEDEDIYTLEQGANTDMSVIFGGNQNYTNNQPFSFANTGSNLFAKFV